jgi:hypothetical protein
LRTATVKAWGERIITPSRTAWPPMFNFSDKSRTSLSEEMTKASYGYEARTVARRSVLENEPETNDITA